MGSQKIKRKAIKINAGNGETRAAAEWKSSELDFRLAVSGAIQHYETALVMTNEGYRKAQLALDSRYRKTQLDLSKRYRKMELGIVSNLNELEAMLQTIDTIKDIGNHRILYDITSGIGYKLIPRECGFNSNGKGIEEKVVNKPK